MLTFLFGRVKTPISIIIKLIVLYSGSVTRRDNKQLRERRKFHEEKKHINVLPTIKFRDGDTPKRAARIGRRKRSPLISQFSEPNHLREDLNGPREPHWAYLPRCLIAERRERCYKLIM